MKLLLKRLARLCAIIAVAPCLFSHWLCSCVGSSDDSLHAHSQFLGLLPGMVGSYLRVAFLRFALQHCDPSATVCFGVLFSKIETEIHQSVYIGPHSNLGLVTLEADVLLGPYVQIPSGPNVHGIESLDLPIRLQPGNPIRVTVGRDSWLGSGAIVLADVAPQTVVGAGSVVTKSFPPCSIIVGNPARLLRSRQNPLPSEL